MHYGLGQVPTELEHGAVGPVNETLGIPLSFKLVLAPTHYSLDSRDH